MNLQTGSQCVTRAVLYWIIFGCLNLSAKPLSSVISLRILTSLGGSELSDYFFVLNRTKKTISPADCVKSLGRDFVKVSSNELIVFGF